jgi:hypothetical protein
MDANGRESGGSLIAKVAPEILIGGHAFLLYPARAEAGRCVLEGGDGPEKRRFFKKNRK